MNNLIRGTIGIGVMAIVVLNFSAEIFATAKSPDAEKKSVSKPDMVIKDDVVSEWRNEKMTELTRLPDVSRTANTANEEPVLIFKHSTTCPISGRAAQRIDEMFRDSEDPLPAFYMVKVIESRPVSQAIAAMYDVKHESPQILLLKDGKAVWNTSHDEITADAVLEAMKEHDAMPVAQPSEKE